MPLRRNYCCRINAGTTAVRTLLPVLLHQLFIVTSIRVFEKYRAAIPHCPHDNYGA